MSTYIKDMTRAYMATARVLYGSCFLPWKKGSYLTAKAVCEEFLKLTKDYGFKDMRPMELGMWLRLTMEQQPAEGPMEDPEENDELCEIAEKLPYLQVCESDKGFCYFFARPNN